MKAIEILKSFVEEKLSTEELEMALSSNQELISLLENTKAKPYMNSNSTYEYLISQDLTSLVDLKQDDRKIVEFINYNKGNYTDEAVFIAQSGYTSKNISNTDFIQTIPKMLLFSETFINKLADKLKNELDFFPAKLRIKNDEFKFFLGKIKLTAELVNMEKSNFYEIDGEKFIDYPPVFFENISGFEFCAKDINDDLFWAFSDKFKELVVSNNLKMEFLPLT